MKIGLLGAPGAGKTKIARRVVKQLNQKGPHFDPPTPPSGGQWKVINGYVERLQKRTGFPYGAMSTFPHNLQVISERWVSEYEATSRGRSTVTCGTIYESIIYSTFATLFTTDGLSTFNNIYNQIMMHTLGLLEQGTYEYDAIFWLPYTEEQVKATQDSWDGVVNAKIPETLSGFNKYAIELYGTDKDKVNRVIEVVNQIHDFTTSQDDESAV